MTEIRRYIRYTPDSVGKNQVVSYLTACGRLIKAKYNLCKVLESRYFDSFGETIKNYIWKLDKRSIRGMKDVVINENL